MTTDENGPALPQGARVLPSPDGVKRCGWPDCRSEFEVAAGPVTEGWALVKALGLAVCPVHSDQGHLPRPKVRGTTTAAMAVLVCECGRVGSKQHRHVYPMVEEWHRHLRAVDEAEAS